MKQSNPTIGDCVASQSKSTLGDYAAKQSRLRLGDCAAKQSNPTLEGCDDFTSSLDSKSTTTSTQDHTKISSLDASQIFFLLIILAVVGLDRLGDCVATD